MRGGGTWAMFGVLGCGPVAGIAVDGGSGEGEGEGAGGASSSVGEGDEAEDAGGGVDDSGGIPNACGDGVLAPDESCDDGDAVTGNGCNPDCRPSGLPLWLVDLAESGEQGSEGNQVAISPLPEIVVAVTHHDADRTAAELVGVDLLGTTIWRHDDLDDGDFETPTGLVVAPDGTQSLAVAVTYGSTSLISLQSWNTDQTLRSIVYPRGGNAYSAALAFLRTDELVVAGYDIVGSDAAYWLESVTTYGSSTWTTDVALQPIALVGLVQGGAYVQYVAGAGVAQIQRLGPDGSVVWQTGSSCAGAMDVDGNDALSIVQSSDPGLRTCRIAADATLTELAPIDIGNSYPTDVAATRGGDLLVGGYTLGPALPTPWLARISGAGVVQWSNGPAVPHGLVLSVDIDDELGIAVASGIATPAEGQHGFVAGFTP